MNRHFKTSIALVIALFVMSQSADAKTRRGRRAAADVQPKAVQCEPLPQTLIPIIETAPPLPPAGEILIAEDPWSLINAQINALQLNHPRNPLNQNSTNRPVAYRKDSNEDSIFGREATGRV